MQTEDHSRPNILWIGVDQMRTDTPGCYGNPVCATPNLDRLARQGVLFTDAYTPCSLCTPARASMLTGRYALKHGMGTNCDLYHALARELPEPEMLLHHRLATLGYRAGFVGKWHVGTQLGPRDYGFEGMNVPGYGDLKREPEFQSYLRENGLTYGSVQDPIYGNPGEKTLIAGRWNGSLESTPTYYLASYTIDLLDRFAGDERPFFLTCQFWGPHPPYLPSPEYAGRHDRRAIPPWANFGDDYRAKPESVRRFRPDFYRSLPDDWEGWREIVGLCYDYTSLVDAQVGRILDRLDQLGLAEDTLVLFTSDHGDMVGSHGGLFDKGFMYQEAHRVPLIVLWPARFQPQRRAELAYNMDLMPTVLDILGQPDPGLDGVSLLPFLDDAPSAAGRDALYLEFHGIRYLYSQRALVTRDGYKYIFTPGDRDEVYDLNRDPAELHNLLDVPDRGPLVQDLRRRLMAASAQAGDPIRDYISKMFGDWDNLSGQPEAASPILGQIQDNVAPNADL